MKTTFHKVRPPPACGHRRLVQLRISTTTQPNTIPSKNKITRTAPFFSRECTSPRTGAAIAALFDNLGADKKITPRHHPSEKSLSEIARLGLHLEGSPLRGDRALASLHR